MTKANIIDRSTVTEKDLARFWAKVDDSDSYGCWNWTAAATKQGYGQFWLGNSMVKAHRFAWVVSQTLDPVQDPDKDICHSCDNRLCCNPMHLRQDTRSSNIKDKRKNGNCGSQKLSYDDVAEIRVLLSEGKLTQTKIAEKFGVNQNIISKIKTGKIWLD